MLCPKCKQENAEHVTYCVRCHAPLKFTCPACQHVQLQGGNCEKCGVDFAKYAAMMVFQAKTASEAERERSHTNASLWRQAYLAPLTGGLSLVKLLLEKLRGR